MKRIISFALSIILCCSFAACDSEKNDEATTSLPIATTTVPKPTETKDEQENLPKITPIIDILAKDISKITISAKNSVPFELNAIDDLDKIAQVVGYLNGFKLKKANAPATDGETVCYEILPKSSGENVYCIVMNENNKIGVSLKGSFQTQEWYEVVDNTYDPQGFYSSLYNDHFGYPSEDAQPKRIDVVLKDGKIKFPDKKIKYIELICEPPVGKSYTQKTYTEATEVSDVKDFCSSVTMGEPIDIEDVDKATGCGSYSIRVYFEDETYMSIGYFLNRYFSFNKNVYDPDITFSDFCRKMGIQ